MCRATLPSAEKRSRLCQELVCLRCVALPQAAGWRAPHVPISSALLRLAKRPLLLCAPPVSPLLECVCSLFCARHHHHPTKNTSARARAFPKRARPLFHHLAPQQTQGLAPGGWPRALRLGGAPSLFPTPFFVSENNNGGSSSTTPRPPPLLPHHIASPPTAHHPFLFSFLFSHQPSDHRAY